MATASTGGTGTRAATTSARRPAGNTTTGAAPQAAATQKSLQAHMVTVAECDVMDPQGLYEFIESLRAVCTGLSFFAHSAGSQLEAAARKGARDAADGRLTLVQKTKLKVILRKMGRRMDGVVSDDLLAAATSAIKTYSLLEDFLEEIESDNVSRPHRNSRGGFGLGGR